MSWNESNFVTQSDINIYEERVTLNQKMRTKLNLEQKRCILDVIERLNYYLKRKAENYYRYDVLRVFLIIRQGKLALNSNFKVSGHACTKFFSLLIIFPRICLNFRGIKIPASIILIR